MVNQKSKKWWVNENGESEIEELVPEWGWRRDKGSWFQRQGEAYNEKTNLVSFREDDVSGRARVTTDEERVPYMRGR